MFPFPGVDCDVGGSTVVRLIADLVEVAEKKDKRLC